MAARSPSRTVLPAITMLHMIASKRGGWLPIDRPTAPPEPVIERPESARGRLARLRARLARSNSALGKGLLALLSRGKLDEEAWEEVEDTLIASDLGVEATTELVESLRLRVKVDGTTDEATVREWLREEIATHPNLVVLGDFNIAPDDRDVHDPKRWHEKILCSTPEREAYRALLDLGLHDSFRLFNDEAGHHSWWDYRLAAFQRGWGLRIDLVLVSEALRSRCMAAGIDREPRTWERPSDHTPAWVELRD